MGTNSELKWYLRPWATPALCVGLGLTGGTAQWLGGNKGDALITFGVMAAIAAVFSLGGRNETIRMMRGDGRDERWALLDVGATAFAGMVIIGILVGAAFWETAHGRTPEPYAPVLFAGAVSYAGAMVWLRRRS
ncbi:MAG TPA: hypothetical protein VHM89_16315 [Acidimicrobiales bacterium]|nr:hypothetical protein [Acidimicrobiales bacterium]